MLSRGARAVARSRARLTSRQLRRFDSHSTGHGGSAFDVAGGTGSESMGRAFYVTLALLPLSMIAYVFASSSDTPLLTRLIDAYRARSEEVDRRNLLHQIACEQAAVDRHLFVGEKESMSGVDLRFPETFNQSSPWNVVAGEGGADMSELVQHYAKKDKEREASRLAQMKDGKVVTVYDDTTGGRFPSWMPFVGTKKEVPRGFKE